MRFEHRYQDSWNIPLKCSVCGEPDTGGKPFVATATVDREFNMTGATSAEVKTKTVSLTFPRCAKCVKATSREGMAQAIAGLVGLVFGIVGIQVGSQVGGNWIWGAATGLVVWIAVSYAAWRAVDALMLRSFDDDMKRRAQLPEIPVTITKRGSGTIAPQLLFTFQNDEYGESFLSMNP